MPIIKVLAICNCIAVLDGFDLGTISYVAPALTAEWGLSSTKLGTVFSSAFLGLGFGALFITPLADRFGRRPLIIFASALTGLAMIASAYCQSVEHFIIARIVTGLGVGILIPLLATYISEFCPSHIRNVNMGILFASGTIGGILGGIIVAELLDTIGWRGVFLGGGCVTLIITISAIRGLPESALFLAQSKSPDALKKTNSVLARLKSRQLEALPDQNPDKKKTLRIHDLFSSNYMKITLSVWMVFICINAYGYFITSWTPQMLVNLGMSLERSIYTGVVHIFGGTIGAISIGALSKWYALRRLVIISLGLGFIVVVLLGGAIYYELWQILMALNFLAGFTIIGAFASIYTITAAYYPSTIRATAIGSCVGVARIGAIIGPFLAGVMLDFGMTVSLSCWIFSSLIFCAMVLLYKLPGQSSYA